MLMARREGTISINIGGRCKLLHRRLPRQDTRYPSQNAGLSPLVSFYVCPLADQGDTKREQLGMFEWPGFRHIDDADDNEEKKYGTFFVNFSPHNKMMRSIPKNARQCLGRSRSSLFLWMSVTVFWRTDEWDSLCQGNIEMNQHRQCLLTMIKNSSGVIMVWQIVCDQNHSFQTPIKVLKNMRRAFQDP